VSASWPKRCALLWKAGSCLLKILDIPRYCIHSHRPEIERRRSEGLRYQLPSSNIEARNIQIRLSFPTKRPASLGWLSSTRNQNTSPPRGRCHKRRVSLVMSPTDEMRHGRPIQHARHLPHRSSGAVPACHHGGQHLDPYTAITPGRCGAKLDANVIVSSFFSNAARCESTPVAA